jgi:hypothetical protein
VFGRARRWKSFDARTYLVKVEFGTISATGSSVPREPNQLATAMYPRRRIERGSVMNASTRAVILVSATWTFGRLDVERVMAALGLRVAARPATRADASIPQHPLA